MLPACVRLRLDRADGSEADGTFSAPTEDGARYVSVEGGLGSTSKALRRRWTRAAEHACDGEYIVLSGAGFARRRNGIVERRIHEGYVRCVTPDPDPDPNPDRKAPKSDTARAPRG